MATYNLEYRIKGDPGSVVSVAGIEDPYYALTDLEYSQVYEWRVQGVNTEGETSDWTAWEDFTLAPSYQLQYRKVNDPGNVTEIIGIEDTSYQLTGLESGQEYEFRVRMVEAGETSAWSDWVNWVTLSDTVLTPTPEWRTLLIPATPRTLIVVK